MGRSGQKYIFLNALSQEIFLRNLETHAALCGATEFSKFSSTTNCVLSQARSQSCQHVLKNNATDTMLCQRMLSLLVFKGSSGQPHLWPCLETVLTEKEQCLSFTTIIRSVISCETKPLSYGSSHWIYIEREDRFLGYSFYEWNSHGFELSPFPCP